MRSIRRSLLGYFMLLLALGCSSGNPKDFKQHRAVDLQMQGHDVEPLRRETLSNGVYHLLRHLSIIMRHLSGERKG